MTTLPCLRRLRLANLNIGARHTFLKMETEYSETSSLKHKFSLDLEPPGPSSQSSLDSSFVVKKPDYGFVDSLINTIQESDKIIARKLEVTENLDISLNIITYKTYEATHDFKNKISVIKDERNQLLTSVENRSEFSLIINDLDRKISELDHELEIKINNFNQQKLNYQEKLENMINELDEDITNLQENMKQLKKKLDTEKGVAYRSQLILINEKYIPFIERIERHLHSYERLQLSGWRMENSETKLAAILEEQGLKFTPSGRLLTKTGSLITFEEAQEKGYFKAIHVSLEKVFDFFKERESDHALHLGSRQPLLIPDSAPLSENSSVQSRMSSEDVKYLKRCVGKPLTLALAEIAAKQPRDPIHYLGHYLFKYCYNQELEELQKREVEDLTQERKRLSNERWKKFIEEEARNAVIDMVLKAEEIAYQNELKRIEIEQLLAQEEEEGAEAEEENVNEKALLEEEAKDKFE